MAKKQNSLERFWKELKRRRVIHVITVYAATAFVILQLVDMISQPLHFPEWTQAFFIVLLCIGFVISVVTSWVYDITPSGVSKTKPAGSIKHPDHTTYKTPVGWKIATYVSFVIIAVLIGFNFINRKTLREDISELGKSIAVLPFKNDSGSDSTAYFVDGLMEEILTNLQRIGAFGKVLSRTSTEKYLKTDKTIPEIAKELGVNFIVEGSGQKYGAFYKTRVQLIEGKSDKHLWADSYERQIREPQDIFSVQSEIAQSIAKELKATITPEEKNQIERTPTNSLTALDFYQRGRDEHIKFWLDNSKIGSLKNAISYYQMALKSDSSFAQAFTGLAHARINSYWLNVNTRMEFSAADLKLVNDSILTLVNQAFKFDKNLDYVYLIRGWCKYDYDLELKEYYKALEINPNNWITYSNIAEALYYGKNDHIGYLKNMFKAIQLERGPFLPGLLTSLGAFYEIFGFDSNAFEVYNQKLQLTKDTVQFFQDMSGPYYGEQNWSESIKWAKKMLEKDSKQPWPHFQLTWIYSFIGEVDSVIYHAERAAELVDNPYYAKYFKAFAYWYRGDLVNANILFNDLIDFSEEVIKSIDSNDELYFMLAKIYSMKGDQQDAIEYFKKISVAYRTARFFVIETENDPAFKNIRGTKEVQEILKDIKSDLQTAHDKVQKWLEENNML